MKTWPSVCLAILAVVCVSCGEEDAPSQPGAVSLQAGAAATTNDCTNSYLGDLSSALSQWRTALDEERGAEFLPTPPSFEDDASAYLTALSPLMEDWKDSLDAWRGMEFLETPPVFEDDINAYLGSLPPTLVTWKDSLETWREKEFLDTPPLFEPDTTAPDITCPPDTTIGCATEEGVAVDFEVIVTDSCDSEPLLDCTPASGSVFPVGITTVTCVATDADSNTSECTFNVTVMVDTTPPEIACPADTTLECTGDGGAVLEFEATATDSCDTEPTVVCEPPSGSHFPVGTTTVTCTAIDDAGNSAQCTFNVTVVDTQPPVIEEITVPAVLWPPNHRMADIMVEVSATDACDDEVSVWVDDVMSNEGVNERGDGNTEPDWELVDPLHVLLRAERQGGGMGRVYTLKIKASDSSGNEADGMVEVRVPHDSRPQ